MTQHSRSDYPDFVDLLPVNPNAATTRTTGPLAIVATDAELRETTVRDPIVGDVISCAELVARDRACWDDVDARWPPDGAYTLSAAEREQMRAARGVCRRRATTLLRVCRVGGVRAG